MEDNPIEDNILKDSTVQKEEYAQTQVPVEVHSTANDSLQFLKNGSQPTIVSNFHQSETAVSVSESDHNQQFKLSTTTN